MSETIPYTFEPRPDTGLTNVKIGIWLFLASEAMLFASLFAAYVLLRVGSISWPRGADLLDVPLGAANTAVLVTSSVTMVMAWASLVRRDFPRYRRFLWATVVLGLVFLVIKGSEYAAKVEGGLLPRSSTFLALYFTLTGLHALHVAAGTLVNAYLAGPGAALWQRRPEQLRERVEAAGLFWHFVDLVWIFLFPVLYLL